MGNIPASGIEKPLFSSETALGLTLYRKGDSQVGDAIAIGDLLRNHRTSFAPETTVANAFEHVRKPAKAGDLDQDCGPFHRS
jgi:hypothetical protein